MTPALLETTLLSGSEPTDQMGNFPETNLPAGGFPGCPPGERRSFEESLNSPCFPCRAISEVICFSMAKLLLSLHISVRCLPPHRLPRIPRPAAWEETQERKVPQLCRVYSRSLWCLHGTRENDGQNSADQVLFSPGNVISWKSCGVSKNHQEGHYYLMHTITYLSGLWYAHLQDYAGHELIYC